MEEQRVDLGSFEEEIDKAIETRKIYFDALMEIKETVHRGVCGWCCAAGIIADKAINNAHRVKK